MTKYESVDGPENTPMGFSQMFGQNLYGHRIHEIEIPIIQRDYAQGRNTEHATRVRENFINSLCVSLLPGANPVDLDFVFGDIGEPDGKNTGKFYPLDGQQRLTTLFLLHCFLAWKNEINLGVQPWIKFSYTTRPSARDFCNYLVSESCRPDFSTQIDVWIIDQSEYLPTWHQDPSIQSMLVVLTSIERWFERNKIDYQIAWERLTSSEDPSIRFHILPVKNNGLTDELYIKMNSRGRPLTPFENFKAHFEQLIKTFHPTLAELFSMEVDTTWSDILWPYRGDDNLIDDEFMRYFRFITEICAWKYEISFKEDIRTDDLAEKVFGGEHLHSHECMCFMIDAWNVWKDKNVQDIFSNTFSGESVATENLLRIFNPFKEESVDLFHACCRHYGTRSWTLAHSLLFYGVILRLTAATDESLQRMRVLRNLIAASTDEIRAGERNNMPKLIEEVEQIIVHGDLSNVVTFNQVHTKSEQEKERLLKLTPSLTKTLYALEDHDLLLGGLTAFEFDSTNFYSRANAFSSIFEKGIHEEESPWITVTAALLTKGDYSRRESRGSGHFLLELGSPKNIDPWRALFRRRKTETFSKPLMDLLDAYAAGETLQSMIDGYVSNERKTWAYYLIKYPVMRIGATGRYTFSPSGYNACMLKKERLSSDYYDPYLFAIVTRALLPNDSIENPKWPCCFYGYETNERKLILKRNGIQIQCVDTGWEVSGIPSAPHESLQGLGLTPVRGNTYLCEVPQVEGVDIADRIDIGARLLSALANI